MNSNNGEVEVEIELSPSSELALPSANLPKQIYLLPLSERPFFPAQTQPLLMNGKPWMETVSKIGDTEDHMVGLFMTQPHDSEFASPEDYSEIGTLARMHHPMKQEKKIQFIAEGIQRARIVRWLSDTPPYLVEVEYPQQTEPRKKDEAKAFAMAIINTLRELIPLNPLYGEELRFFLDRFSPNEPSALTDFAASLTTATPEDLQKILETLNIKRRMKQVLTLLKKDLDVAKLQTKIRDNVEDKMDDQQRRFFLREQLKVIQKELGIAKDDRTADTDRFTDRMKKLTIPKQSMKKIDEEMEKLGMLETGSPEYAVTRNYLDQITGLPWGIHSKDKLNLRNARTILDRDHDSLEDVKDRIIEFLAVGKLKGEVNGSILLLVGPPGVGKTSIGKSVADALGRKFYRFSVGGMRDEAEIKGHRRTYIGAMPGKFIQAISECETQNPIIMLDEIDKIGASYHGDPASALLEVLDPEQNVEFLDHYLDTRFDLSKVLFICTANQLDSIPAPLLDRMETIRLSGYITEEKIKIAKHHLWPRQLERSGIKSSLLKISDAALRKVIDGYARESGVRNLEKQLGRIIRKVAVKIVNRKKGPFKVNTNDVVEYLEQPIFQSDKPYRGVGVVTGLAWTSMGGETLTIEASKVHSSSRGFKLTGQLGDVMQESAEIAYSYISSHLEQYGADPTFFEKAQIHLHVPAGATPKDGPSAGSTMAVALLSMARNYRLSRPFAMTGELTLTGRVLPIGGVREKTIAARRQKIKELIFPAENRFDFEELPDYIREGITPHFVEHFDDIEKIIFHK
ncbi:MAG: endopeptidase La [Thiotrichales bacterium]|jgi:ATP-dependent Lon protease|nr:endopeptidase La [Thiotrichales bacterium]MBT3613557.1 endopeptidase La [Thiotrichales bacterium]MBT3752365.1 endopeptidase La [Thiotrichales bacterium]MBT3838029.1 endopeptidase La [Thiotrichales bacterium]MBT4152136.1 endopeptidase La [Thiotrichales bacterium]